MSFCRCQKLQCRLASIMKCRLPSRVSAPLLTVETYLHSLHPVSVLEAHGISLAMVDNYAKIDNTFEIKYNGDAYSNCAGSLAIIGSILKISAISSFAFFLTNVVQGRVDRPYAGGGSFMWSLARSSFLRWPSHICWNLGRTSKVSSRISAYCSRLLTL